MSKRFMSLEDFMSKLTYGPSDSKYCVEGSEVDDTYDVLQGSSYPIIFTADDEEEFEVDFVEQEGGGEGGSEYCYSILKIGEKFYKIEYSYYSHAGYETEDAELVEVSAKQQTVTVYE